jgi:hypothetical protein
MNFRRPRTTPSVVLDVRMVELSRTGTGDRRQQRTRHREKHEGSGLREIRRMGYTYIPHHIANKQEPGPPGEGPDLWSEEGRDKREEGEKEGANQ